MLRFTVGKSSTNGMKALLKMDVLLFCFNSSIFAFSTVTCTAPDSGHTVDPQRYHRIQTGDPENTA